MSAMQFFQRQPLEMQLRTFRQLNEELQKRVMRALPAQNRYSLYINLKEKEKEMVLNDLVTYGITREHYSLLVRGDRPAKRKRVGGEEEEDASKAEEPPSKKKRNDNKFLDTKPNSDRRNPFLSFGRLWPSVAVANFWETQKPYLKFAINEAFEKRKRVFRNEQDHKRMVASVYKDIVPLLLNRLSSNDPIDQRKYELLQLVRTLKGNYLYAVRVATLDIVLKRNGSASRSLHDNDREYWNKKWKDESQRFQCITVDSFRKCSSNSKTGPEDSQVINEWFNKWVEFLGDNSVTLVQFKNKYLDF